MTTPDPAGLREDIYRRFVATLRSTGTLGRARTRRTAVGMAEAYDTLRQVLAETDFAALATPAPLDEAWAEAEAALPYKRNEVSLTHIDWNGDEEKWVAVADSMTAGMGDVVHAEGEGPAPVAALRTLATRLRGDTPEGNG